ncbi:unnamed protein product [Brassica oleracea var. botrytis]
MLVSGCFCCGKPLKPGGSRALALVLFIVSWIFFLIAEICLLAGSVENAYHTKYRTMFMDNPPDCQTLRKGVFAAGASFVFFNAIVSQFYYFFYSSAADASLSPY